MQMKNTSFILRAAGGSYLILCSIWLLLSSGYFWLGIHRGFSNCVDVALLCLSITAVICGWLCGFRIIVTDAHLEYRGGNYLTTRIPLAEIGRIMFTWIEWSRTGNTVKILRLVVITRDRKVAAVINSQPFKGEELQRLVRQLERLDGYDAKLKMKGKVNVSTLRMFFDLIWFAITVLSIWFILIGVMRIVTTCWP